MPELNEEHEPKGANVLVYIFLALFALYYFFNWKFLAVLWHVS